MHLEILRMYIDKQYGGTVFLCQCKRFRISPHSKPKTCEEHRAFSIREIKNNWAGSSKLLE
jgi:hypothetical protein